MSEKYDPLAYQEDQIGQTEEEVIPEGEQLFTLWNMWFGNLKMNPPGARRSTDFKVFLNMKWKHDKTGLFLSRVNNGQGDPWNRMFPVQRIGNTDTRPMYNEFMISLGAKNYRKNGTVGYHVMENNQRVFTPHDDKEFPGVLGLPAKLTVIHKEVPVMKAIEGAVKNQYGRYDPKELIETRDEKDKIITQIKEFIVCTTPVDPNDFKQRIESGWPILGTLTVAEKKIRGEYQTKTENIVTDEEVAEGKKAEQKVDW